MSDVRGKKKKKTKERAMVTATRQQKVGSWCGNGWKLTSWGNLPRVRGWWKMTWGLMSPCQGISAPTWRLWRPPSSNPLAYFPNLCLNAAPSAFALNTFLFYCHLGFPSQPVTPLNESVLAIFSPPLPISFPSIFTLSVIPPPGLSRLALHYFPVFRAALTCVVVFGLNLN